MIIIILSILNVFFNFLSRKFNKKIYGFYERGPQKNSIIDPKMKCFLFSSLNEKSKSYLPNEKIFTKIRAGKYIGM